MKQLVVWEGTIVGPHQAGDFENWLAEQGFKVKYVEEYETLPDVGNPETGGRNDVIFEIAPEDVVEFSMWRLGHGMRWWEDVVANQIAQENVIIPADVLERHPVQW